MPVSRTVYGRGEYKRREKNRIEERKGRDENEFFFMKISGKGFFSLKKISKKNRKKRN